MTFTLLLKLALVLTPVLIWLLRRSKHPVARKLLTVVGPRTDHARMTPAQIQITARHFLLLGLVSGAITALLFVLADHFTRDAEAQVTAAVAIIILVILAFLFLLNSAHFALIAYNRRAVERRTSAQTGTAASLRPR